MSRQHSRRTFLKHTAAAAAGGLLTSRWALGDEYRTQPNHGKLIAHTTDVMNAEPPLKDLIQSWITPNELFYIRSHAPVPKIDTQSFRLIVDGLVQQKLELSLEEIAAFPQHSAVATMTCAGNRRFEHSKISPIQGVPWQEGAIGNAKWTGARLSDILKKAGVRPEAKHVWFDGLDEIERDSGIIPFGASIPLTKAMNDAPGMPGTLLCTHMNDVPLPPDHGYPLRTVVPGYIGARSVKWLGRLTVSDKPSTNHYVDHAYKLVTEGTPVEWDEQGPIYQFPLNSVICSLQPNEQVQAGEVDVAGYAYPQGDPGVTVRRVQVSADGGKSWINANLTSPVQAYCWVLWKARIPVKQGATAILVRAIDSRRRVQPRRVDWNLKGYLYNAWHQVPIRVQATQ